MSEKRAPPVGAPSDECPACLEAFDTSNNTVSFDCGHAACLHCVTAGLRVHKSSIAAEKPWTVQPLACFLGRGSCKGALFYSQTRAVLRRILPPGPAAASAPVAEPPLADAAAPPDPDAAAADADRPPPASPDSAVDIG
jgi:hypothetical protein